MYVVEIPFNFSNSQRPIIELFRIVTNIISILLYIFPRNIKRRIKKKEREKEKKTKAKRRIDKPAAF